LAWLSLPSAFRSIRAGRSIRAVALSVSRAQGAVARLADASVETDGFEKLDSGGDFKAQLLSINPDFYRFHAVISACSANIRSPSPPPPHRPWFLMRGCILVPIPDETGLAGSIDHMLSGDPSGLPGKPDRSIMFSSIFYPRSSLHGNQVRLPGDQLRSHRPTVVFPYDPP